MSDLASLTARLDAMRGVRVLCLGDAMLDRFVHGEVERISPEAPIPVFRIRGEEAMPGGAGNVVRNLVALGALPALVAVVGDDAAGRELGRLLGALRSLEPCLLAEPGRVTTVKTRYVAGGQQLLRADRETAATVSALGARRILRRVTGLLPGVAAVVLSDYGKGVLSPAVVSGVMAAARAAGRPVLVDPKGRDYRVYAGATLLTPNRKELGEATAMPVGNDAEIVAAARHLLDACQVGAVLATRSRDGMTLVRRDSAPLHLPAEAREVFDVSGAGDTVMATVAAALASGADLADAARLANLAAGIVVGKVGTAVASRAELKTLLRRHDVLDDVGKVMGVDAVREVAARWRRAGLTVGFTNGCFDLLHPGHVSLLRQARAACDRLVVGLNTDDSVRRLKGPARPVQTETARAAVLASLGAVDAVVPFGEDTPLALIEAIRPDLLVKGADYAEDEVVGADLVRSYGGRVLLADLVAGQSTTGTIARMGR